MQLGRIGAVLAACGLAVVSMASPSLAHSSDGPKPARLADRLDRFMTPEAAIAAGYLPDPHCVESPLGVMGHHYLNPDLVDGKVQKNRPEVLVYQPTGPNGALRLAAVEYLVPADLAKDHPDLKGVPFEGPMPGHGPGMPVHYDLHVWLFQHNPDGAYATWNPAGTCGD